VKLFFLRHGIAEDYSPTGRDADRRLTAEGLTEMDAVGAGMAALGLRFDLLLSSPKVRARQTAEIAAAALGQGEQLKLEAALGHGCGLIELREILADVDGKSRVLLVGHQPDLSENIGALIGGGCVQMKKASLACLEVERIEPGGGELRWLLPSKQLAQLGAATGKKV
jgi:phosphohistidine phosphatase